MALASRVGAGVGIQRWGWGCYLVVVGVGDVAALSDVGDGLAVGGCDVACVGIGVASSLVLRLAVDGCDIACRCRCCVVGVASGCWCRGGSELWWAVGICDVAPLPCRCCCQRRLLSSFLCQHPHLPPRAVARRLGGGAVLGW